MTGLCSRADGAERVMVLAPHPDDESLATGAALQSAIAGGAQVRVVFVTDGENNPWAQRATERRWRIRQADRARWGERRRREALAALECLGVTPEAVRFLGLPDQNVTEALFADPAGVVGRLAGELVEWQPTVLFAPSIEDSHPDHSAVAVIARMALAGLPRLSEGMRVLDYVVHSPARFAGGRESFVVVPSRIERERKRRAIRCHASQLQLRAAFLMRFADEPEQFEFGPSRYGDDASHHPLSLLHATRGEWSFAVHHGIDIPFGRATLLLVSLDNGAANTLRVTLPRGIARRPLLAANGREALGELFTTWSGDDLLVTVQAPRLEAAGLCLAKLDLPWVRRLSFFDPWPWLAFGPGAIQRAPRPIELAERIPLNAAARLRPISGAMLTSPVTGDRGDQVVGEVRSLVGTATS